MANVNWLVEALDLLAVPIVNWMAGVEDLRDLAANENLVCIG